MKQTILHILNTHFIWVTGILAFAAYWFSAAFYIWHDQITLYNDARSRLLLSRSVIDSLTPGLVQLGGVWPPIPQIFFIPTIWHDLLFYSGLSGTFVSLLFATFAAIFLAKLLLHLTQNKRITATAVCLFILNPSFLYMATTPMSEVPFIALVIMSVYFLYHWSQTKNVFSMFLAAIFASLACLTRYEGYFLPIVGAGIIMLQAKQEHAPFEQIRGKVLLYANTAFAGIVLWLLYGLVIFGNPFNFIAGETNTYSRAAGALSGTLTKGNIAQTMFALMDAARLNIGFISLLVLGIAGAYALIRKQRRFLMVLSLFFAPIAFVLLSLFLGVSDIFTWNNAGYLYNVRIGLLIIPLVPIGYALLAQEKCLRNVLSIAMAAQILLLFTKPPITLLEATNFTYVDLRGQARMQLTNWLKQHPKEGNVLISYVINQTVIFDARIPPATVISEGTGDYWHTALVSPIGLVDRIIVSPHEGDEIWQQIRSNSHYLDSYSETFRDDFFVVYDKI